MNRRKRKIAAITTAVFAYIQADQETSRKEAVQEEIATPDRGRSYPVVSPWALSGRQTMMDWRRHLQFRMR